MPTREDIDALAKAYRKLDDAKRSIKWIQDRIAECDDDARRAGIAHAEALAEVARLERVCGVTS